MPNAVSVFGAGDCKAMCEVLFSWTSLDASPLYRRAHTAADDPQVALGLPPSKCADKRLHSSACSGHV